MANTGLLGGPRLTPEDVRRTEFPRVFRGYDVVSVEKFRARLATQLNQLYQALDERAASNHALLEEVARLGQPPPLGAPVAPVLPNEQQAVNILRAAQQNADTIVGQARQQADRMVGEAAHARDQLTEHASQQADQLMRSAKQQADDLVAAARQHAEAERVRIIDAATADARRDVVHLTKLAADIRDTLRADTETLYKQVSEWQRLTHEGAEPESPPRSLAD
jgi:DivIVA domain-containing protein